MKKKALGFYKVRISSYYDKSQESSIVGASFQYVHISIIRPLYQ